MSSQITRRLGESAGEFQMPGVEIHGSRVMELGADDRSVAAPLLLKVPVAELTNRGREPPRSCSYDIRFVRGIERAVVGPRGSGTFVSWCVEVEIGLAQSRVPLLATWRLPVRYLSLPSSVTVPPSVVVPVPVSSPPLQWNPPLRVMFADPPRLSLHLE